MIDQKTATEKVFFGSREVKNFGKGAMTGDDGTTFDSGLAWVEYMDGGREVMNFKEWSAGVSFQPQEENFDFDKKRLMPAVEDMLKLLNAYNLRLEDIMTVFTLVRDTIQLAVDQSKEVAFGQPAWVVRIDDIQKVLDDGKRVGNLPVNTGIIRQVQGSAVRY